MCSRLDAEELSWFVGHLRHLFRFLEEHLGQLRPKPLLRIGPNEVGLGAEQEAEGGADWLPELREMLKAVIEVRHLNFEERLLS